MLVRFWGTRGSIAAPGSATARYGGNTSCVEVRTDDGTLIVLDCGTGARALGLHLARSAPPSLRLNLFIGHTHWDHIQGFPFFVPAFTPGVELNIYAPVGFQRSLGDTMAGQMEYAYFPVTLRDLRSRIHFTELDEGFFRLGDVLVETQYLNHTAPTIAYRISAGGATIAYTTDHEPFGQPAGNVSDHPGDQSHVAFLSGADLVIHDAQYSDDEYQGKSGWGHSPVRYATDVALAAGARRLALFHHDPAHDDAMIERLEASARDRVARAGGGLEVFAAAEGLELRVNGRGAARPVAAASALHRRPLAGGRVLLVSSNEAEIGAIEEILAADDLSVVAVPDLPAALARGPEIAPDLAIVDAPASDGETASLVRPLRDRVGRPNFPILLLTGEPSAAGAALKAGAPFCDYLTKPFSPPMLHARVRAWLARALATPAASGENAAAARPGGAADLTQVLLQFALFRTLAPEQLRHLVQGATEHTYPAGHVIVSEGEFDDRVFVVLSGRVRVMETMADAMAEVVLGGLGEGEVFGELSTLAGRPRSATVVATERTRCLALRHQRFIRTLERSPDMALALLRLLARRLLEADRLLARYAPDTLTGVASRRAFHDQYRRLAAGARRRKSNVLLLLFDVVHLGAINDRFGYAVGDSVLCTVADALIGTTRTTDLVARYGADEFAVLLMDAQPTDLDSLLDRMAAKLAELGGRRSLSVDIQCRVGVAFRDVPPETADELLRAADAKMRDGRRVPA